MSGFDWSQAMLGPRPGPPLCRAFSLLPQPDICSSTEPLRVLATDGRQYLVKPIDNPVGRHVVLPERIVHSAGAFLGAPLARHTLITLPDRLASAVVYSDGSSPQPGVAHAVEWIAEATQGSTRPEHPRRDSNSYRMARYIALWLWCDGQDEQFLYDEESSLTAIDHGCWMNYPENEWPDPQLVHASSRPRSWPNSVQGVNPAELLHMAGRLRGFTEQEALRVTGTVPVEWGYDDSQLVVVAEWLHRRAAPTADALDALAMQAAPKKSRKKS